MKALLIIWAFALVAFIILYAFLYICIGDMAQYQFGGEPISEHYWVKTVNPQSTVDGASLQGPK